MPQCWRAVVCPNRSECQGTNPGTTPYAPPLAPPEKAIRKLLAHGLRSGEAWGHKQLFDKFWSYRAVAAAEAKLAPDRGLRKLLKRSKIDQTPFFAQENI